MNHQAKALSPINPTTYGPRPAQKAGLKSTVHPIHSKSILTITARTPMSIRIRSIRLRTALAAIAAIAIAIAAAREAAIWNETRKFIDFHQWRARWLRDKASQIPSDRPDFARDFRRYAAWHDERVVFYRRAHKTYFSDELIEDFRQTEREQVIERILNAGVPAVSVKQPPR